MAIAGILQFTQRLEAEHVLREARMIVQEGWSWALTAYLRLGRRTHRGAIEYVEAAADDRRRPSRAKRSVWIAPDE
ncbi:MAG TPA: hypothetical protein VF386_10185, partial [Usitatibacter sp.]